MNVTVSLWYVPACPECVTECDRISKAAVRDPTVTKLTLSAGHKHNHAERAAGAVAAPSTAPGLPPSGELFDASQLNGTGVALNGFDSAG